MTQLRSWGIKTSTATSAEEALTLWKELSIADNCPHIAILDHRLPDHSGVWLAEAIKSSDAGGRTRMILLSSLATRLRPVEAAYFHRTLTKPVKIDALKRLLSEMSDRVAPDSGSRTAHGQCPERYAGTASR